MIPFKQYITELSKPNDVDLVKAAFRDLRNSIGHDEFASAFKDYGVWHSSPRASWSKDKIATRSLIKTSLEKYGFKLVGAGAKGAAFSHDKYPYIIKIFSYDRGYTRYVKFVNAHPNNIYVPKFKGQPTKIFDEIYYIRVEKLLPIDRQNPKLPSLMGKLVEITRQLRSYGEVNLDGKALKFDSDMMEICEFLAKTPLFMSVDLHDGNFMARPNGEIVIIDPLIGD